MAEKTGNPCASSAATSRTPPSRTKPGQSRRLGRRRQHLAPIATVGHLADVHHEHAPPRCRRDRHVHGQVVPRGAADGVGRGGHGSAGPGRSKPAVRRQATRLADGGRTQSRQRRRDVPGTPARGAHFVILLGRVPVHSTTGRGAHQPSAAQPYTPPRARRDADRDPGRPVRRWPGGRARRAGPGGDRPAGAGGPCTACPHRGHRRRRRLARPPRGGPRRSPSSPSARRRGPPARRQP